MAPPLSLFPKRPVRITALLIWLAVGAAVALPLGASHLLVGGRAMLWTAAFATFGAAVWRSSRRGPPLEIRTGVLLVLVQSVSALLMVSLACTGLEGVLLVIAAAQLPAYLRLTRAVLWVVAQTALFAILLLVERSIAYSILGSVGHLGLQLFTLFAISTAIREGTARVELARLYAELRATQGLLVDGARTAERLRISRELHDALGHHLTALSLNLEVASHVPAEAARGHVEKARSIARLLLQDVRGVVTALRDDGGLDLGAALRALVDGVPRPRIHLTVGEDVRVEDPVVAQNLLRVAQEVVTNAIKHSEAENLWLELACDKGAVRIVARDDGRGAAQVQHGYGLRGIGERVSACGGRLDIESDADAGFRLRAWIPLTAAAP